MVQRLFFDCFVCEQHLHNSCKHGSHSEYECKCVNKESDYNEDTTIISSTNRYDNFYQKMKDRKAKELKQQQSLFNF